MKKNVQLDTKGFLLVETLLVSLTIASILVYMYVQYSKITDSYKRLNHYNTVESLYRTDVIKQIIEMNATAEFYSSLGSNPLQITGGISSIPGVNFSNIINDLQIESLYVVGPSCNFFSNNVLKNGGYGPFLNTISESEQGKYQIIVRYKGINSDDLGSFAIVSFQEPNS